MSLEAKIELLTAAVMELTRAISNARLVDPVSAPLDEIKIYPNSPAADTTEKSADKSAAKVQDWSSDTANTADLKAPNEPESSTQKSAEQSVQTGGSSSPELTYKDHVKPATLKLSQQKGRDVAIAVLARFGVKGAQDLDESQWADYVAQVDKVLAGGEV